MSYRTIHGTIDNQSEKIQFYHLEHEELSNLKIQYQKENGRWANFNTKQVQKSTQQGNGFYNGIISYSFLLPEQKNKYAFSYSYEIRTTPLLFLSQLSLSTKVKTDSLIYRLVFPKDYELFYRVEGEPSIVNKVSILKTIKEDSMQQLTFKLVNPPINQLHYHPEIRLFMGQKQMDSFQSFTRQYRQLLPPSYNIESTTVEQIHRVLEKEKYSKNRLFGLFYHLQKNFQYIDIENGLRALIPHDVNTVWKNKMGDCKDLSVLLCAMYRHWGYDSYLALASSNPLSYELDFPGLSSVNHVICMVKKDNDWLYFDPADKGAMPGIPSFNLEGKKILLIGQQEGTLITVPIVPVHKNKTQLHLHLTDEHGSIHGKFEANYFFHASSSLRMLNQKEIYTLSASNFLFGSFFPFEMISQTNSDSLSKLTGTVSTRDLISSVEGQNYLQLQKLPFPHSFPQYLKPNEKLCTNFGQTKQVKIHFQLSPGSTKIQEKQFRFEEGGFSFSFNIIQSSPDKFFIQYQYTIEQPWIEGEQIPIYNKWNSFIKSIFQKTIILN